MKLPANSQKPVIIINISIQNIQLKDINKGRDQIYPALVIFPLKKVDRIYRTNQAEARTGIKPVTVGESKRKSAFGNFLDL